MEGDVVVCAGCAEGEKVLVGMLVFDRLRLGRYAYLCGLGNGFAEELDLKVAVGRMELLPLVLCPAK